MDFTVQWTISADVESLVDSIVECKKGLANALKAKNPFNTRLKVVACDAYASPKLCELLNLSELCTLVDPDSDVEIVVDERHPIKQSEFSTPIAGFELFTLYNDEIIGDDRIRIIVLCEVGNDNVEIYYGNVELVSS
jgi:hypothetical protein